MSGGRPRYFTVSETLQAVLDEIESDDDHDDELWADDDVSLEQTPCTSSTAIARSPPTPTLVSPGLESLSHSKLLEVAVSILKAPVDESALTSALLPPELTPAGLTHDRKRYLYNSIRKHVRTDFRDKLCPNPNV